MVFRCPKCKRGLSLNESRWAGKRIRLKCPGCGHQQVFEVPPAGAPGAGRAETSPGTPGPARRGPGDEARRIARLIVQEIGLYHEKLLEGLNTRRQVLVKLRGEIGKGKRHYLSRVAPDIPDREEIFNQAVREILLQGKS